MKVNKKRQTIEMHFRYNKIYDTAVSPKPSTRHGAKVKILSKNSSIASAFNYTLPIALKIYGYNCAYKSTMSEFSSCLYQAPAKVPKGSFKACLDKFFYIRRRTARCTDTTTRSVYLRPFYFAAPCAALCFVCTLSLT